MKHKQIFISKLLFFMLIGSLGAFASFINLHLEQVVGLSGSQIGFITFLGLITTVIVTPIWGYFSDKTGRHIFLLKLTFLLVCAMGVFYYASRTFALAVIGVILFETFRAPTNPLLDYVATNYCEKYKYDFGKIRVIGSLGYVVIAMITGFMVAGMDFNLFGLAVSFSGFVTLQFATFGIFVIMNAIALVLMFFLSPSSEEKKEDAEEKMRTIKPFNKEDVYGLLKNKPFLFILILTMIGYMTIESAFSYATMHLVTVLNASESIVSFVAFFLVIPELFLLYFGSKIIKKVGFKNWYLLTFITMGLRLATYSFATVPMVFVLGGSFHGIMMAMHIIGNINYVRKVVEVKTLGLAFTILTSSMSLSRALLSFLFGWIYENISSFMVFRVALVFIVVGFFIALFSKDLKKVGDEIVAGL